MLSADDLGNFARILWVTLHFGGRQFPWCCGKAVVPRNLWILVSPHSPSFQIPLFQHSEREVPEDRCGLLDWSSAKAWTFLAPSLSREGSGGKYHPSAPQWRDFLTLQWLSSSLMGSLAKVFFWKVCGNSAETSREQKKKIASGKGTEILQKVRENIAELLSAMTTSRTSERAPQVNCWIAISTTPPNNCAII